MKKSEEKNYFMTDLMKLSNDCCKKNYGPYFTKSDPELGHAILKLLLLLLLYTTIVTVLCKFKQWDDRYSTFSK